MVPPIEKYALTSWKTATLWRIAIVIIVIIMTICHDDDNGVDGDDVDDVYGNHLSSELIIAVKLNSVKLLWKHLCWTTLSF